MNGAVKSDSAEIPSTRWWESYLVRYFLGFIVGCSCVLFVGVKLEIIGRLLGYLSGPGLTSIKPDWSSIVLLVAILGLGFCYIASTPITVLHAGRYRRGWFDGHSRHFWFAWIVLCIFMLAIGVDRLGRNPVLERIAIAASTFSMFLTLIKNDKPVDKTHPRFAFLLFIVIWCLFFWGFLGRVFDFFGAGLSETSRQWWVLSLPVFWILIGQYFVLYRLLHEREAFFAFYAKIFKARRMKGARDVRDTYTHLREHSNSVFIVVIEIALFALFMAVFNTISDCGGELYVDGVGVLFVFCLLIWMVPTVFMWARANSLEVEFSENPSDYLK
ncbi:hypothetical protein [Paracidovorax wautersii]|uniref:hypothetical protein n=1 Tax=Paracidovorax wautersii TaxID=1177982 RepID=UPI00286B6DE6|nr:hypothetical protein [Paracidovorax wautersii]